jgi:hypothetical protein
MIEALGCQRSFQTLYKRVRELKKAGLVEEYESHTSDYPPNYHFVNLRCFKMTKAGRKLLEAYKNIWPEEVGA